MIVSDNEMCTGCKKHLNFLAHLFGNICPKCKRNLCGECLSYSEDFHPYVDKHICVKCTSDLQDLIKDTIVVLSGHIGGHKITKHLDLLVSPKGYSTKNEAVDWLKFSSVKLGGNAIIDLNVERSRDADVFSYKVTGKAVIAKKNERSSPAKYKSKNKSSITDEIAGLAQLWEDGLLTDEEFKTAKAKIIRE
jgi:uncharacterized protein YbjQ (UPF0145 family)